jgi:hypothetical protein
MQSLLKAIALNTGSHAPSPSPTRSRRLLLLCLSAALTVGVAFFGCVDNDRSLVIMFATFPDEETCELDVQSGTTVQYSSSGTLDLNHPSFDGEPFFIIGAQVHNFILLNPGGSDQGNNINVMLKRIDVGYKWIAGRELLQNNPTALEVEDLDHSMPLGGTVSGAEDLGSPGRTVFSATAIPREVGRLLHTIDPAVVDALTLSVNFQVVGETTGGSIIKSNRFRFPLYLCWNCLPGSGGCWPGQSATTSGSSSPDCDPISNVSSSNLSIGQDYNIRWDDGGGSGRVDIFLECDGDSSSIVQATDNDGSYNWTVTGPASDSCYFIVQCSSDASNSDRSSRFSISD